MNISKFSRFYHGTSYLSHFTSRKICICRYSPNLGALQPNTKNVILRKYRSNSGPPAEIYRDLEDIKALLNVQLSETEQTEKKTQLKIVDRLIERRLDQISFSQLQKDVSEVTPEYMYDVASKIFNLQNKVGEEATIVAAPLFQIAALSGNKNAKYSYGQLLSRGTGIQQDPVQAVSLFSELAKEGHAYAQFALAGMYYTGFGVDQSYDTSFTLYQVAAENGVVQGFNSIGKMYLKGEGVTEDAKKAVEYFRLGADGDPQACMSLAHCYSHGKGVEVNFDKAFLYHEKAADMGYAPAIYNVGTHYFAGKGVTFDMAKAAQYFQHAADKGFTLALVNLGNMYCQGLGVDKDLEKAKECYRRAAPHHYNARLLLEELELEEKQNENKKPEE